jgi:UDP-N-acetylmuramate dehydrogenase
VQPDGRVKLAAAWLIERAGFAKGTTRGNVGISHKHALALVNRGGATATELLAFADEIVAGVEARFGITLVPEPIVVR